MTSFEITDYTKWCEYCDNPLYFEQIVREKKKTNKSKKK